MSEEDRHALRVFIGPVQGYIGSGRRTRDFWAGSFLLSRLAGEAMAEVASGERPGEITIPVVREGETIEPTLKAITRMHPTGDGNYIIEGTPPPGPSVGTLVNHFRAVVPPDFHLDRGDRIAEAVRARFRAIAAPVNDVFIEEVLKLAAKHRIFDSDQSKNEQKINEIRRRWKFQTNGDFFEVMWVEGAIRPGTEGWRDESRWLDARKMSRDRRPQSENNLAGLTGTGDPCPIHPEYSELGGFNRRWPEEREAQDKFWEAVRYVVGRRMYEEGGAGTARNFPLPDDWPIPENMRDQFLHTLELREDERLSGFALVKRLFALLEPKRIANAIGWVPDHVYGLDVRTSDKDWDPAEARRALRNWPSTAFVAAIPWVVKIGNLDRARADAYAKKQYATLDIEGASADRIWSERPQYYRVEGINRLREHGKQGRVPQFVVLDGTLHFERGLAWHRFVGWRRRKARDESDRRAAQGEAKSLSNQLASAFRDFVEPFLANNKVGRTASPFYAMLEMDGDGMGEVFSATQEQAEAGSKRLLAFAACVPKVVYEHDGILIYAGADDVKALLPIETAISCALRLNNRWCHTMAGVFGDDKNGPTLSGSIVFADYQVALSDVYRLTHSRLDSVAKEKTGRNALALAVLKAGGTTAEWASCWEGAGGEQPIRALLEMAYRTQEGEGHEHRKRLASRLPYVFRQRFADFLRLKDASGQEAFDDEKLGRLLNKEISDSGVSSGGETKARAQDVVAVLRPQVRNREKHTVGGRRDVDGLLIARFLTAQCLWSYYEDWDDRDRSR